MGSAGIAVSGKQVRSGAGGVSVASGQLISRAEFAYVSVRDRILKGELPLGARLSRRNLAVELDMSLIPVAEALQRLESEVLVESRPRVGTRV